MRTVLSDLALESEAAVATWIRLAHSFGESASGNEEENHFRRIATAISKYWICKRAPLLAYEAMECHGGNGFVEENPMAKLYRQSALNAIWEGSGNVICLDVLRAMSKEPESLASLYNYLAQEKGADSRLDGFTASLMSDIDTVSSDASLIVPRLRQIVDRLAVALQATVLMQSNVPDEIVSAFISSRIPAISEHASSWLSMHNLGAGSADVAPATQTDLLDRVSVSTKA